MGNSLFSLNEAFDICGTIVISCQGSPDILEVKHKLGKVMNSYSYIEIGIKQSLVSAPFNPQLLGQRFSHIWHNLHQPFGTLFRHGPVIVLTLNGNESKNKFGVLVIPNGFFVDDLCKFFPGHIGQARLMFLQYRNDLPNGLLPVSELGFQILNSVSEVAEVEGEDEDNEEETKFEENAAEGESIFLWSGGMGWMFYLDDKFECIHAYLLVKMLHILI